MNTTIIKLALLLLFLLWSIYCFYTFYSNSKLVYSYREEISIKDVDLEFDGSLSARDLYFKNVYDAKKNDICDSRIVIKGYQWSKITSLHRLIFLDRNGIRNAEGKEKIYYYLYKNNWKILLTNKAFGLSVSNPPSKIFLYSDYFRDSTKISFIILIILLSAITVLEKKFMLGSDLDLFSNIPTPIVILLAIIILLF